MTKLEQLIQEICPDGVEYIRLDKCATMKRGVRVVKSQLSTDDGYPVYQNSMTPLGYYGKYNFPKETVFIISAGAAGEVGYSLTDFWAADDCWCFVCSSDLNSRYLYHVLLWKQEYLYSKVRKASIPRLSRIDVDCLRIPVPPLPVQAEIVRILDNFTELITELTIELTARRKQYEYYNNELLCFNNVPYKSLEELCDIVDYRGKTPKKVDNGVFLVTAKNIRKGYIDYEKSQEFVSPNDYADVMRRGLPKVGDVLITTEAPCGNVAQIDREDIALAQRVIKYRPKSDELNSTFLKYILLGIEFQSKLLAAATGGTVKGIKGSKLHKLTIPVPPLAEQERIVAILDCFDTLCNDLTSGLPAEIEARQKQYEYYRDKLLTFKEKI